MEPVLFLEESEIFLSQSGEEGEVEGQTVGENNETIELDHSVGRRTVYWEQAFREPHESREQQLGRKQVDLISRVGLWELV